MPRLEYDRDALRAALEREGRHVAALLRDGAPMDAPVPGLAWNSGQLAAHLCLVCLAFTAALRGERLGLDFGPDRATLPETLAAANARALREVSFSTGAEAADGLTDGLAGLLTALDAGDDLHASCGTPWYGARMSFSAGTLMALAGSELLVHGRDLALALGKDTRPGAERRASAAAVAGVVMSGMLPHLLDPARAQGLDACFEVRIRGGQRFLLRVADGAARSEAVDGAEADCVLSLAGYTALLVGFRRIPVWRAIATGQALSYGRRAWLGPRFSGYFLTA